MATFSRHADVEWTGSIMEGKGQVKAGSGAFALPVMFPARIGEPAGTTEARRVGARRLLCDGAERHRRPQGRFDWQNAHHGHRDR